MCWNTRLNDERENAISIASTLNQLIHSRHEVLKGLWCRRNRIADDPDLLKYQYFDKLEKNGKRKRSCSGDCMCYFRRKKVKKQKTCFADATCEKARKRKELEVEILSRNVVGYEGNLASSFGVPLAITNATLQVDTHGVCTETKDRILILYPSFILTFSYSSEKDQYKFEGKLSFSTLHLNDPSQYGNTACSSNDYTRQNATDVQNDKRVLELTGSLTQRLLITFPTNIEYNNWRELLSKSMSRKHSPVQMNADRNDTETLNNLDMFPTMQTSGNNNCEDIGQSCDTSSFCRPAWIPNCPRRCIRPHCTQKQIPDEPSRNGIAALSDGNRSFRRGIKYTRKMKSHGSVDVLKRFETSESDALLLNVIESYHKYSKNVTSQHTKGHQRNEKVNSLVLTSHTNNVRSLFPVSQDRRTATISQSNERNIIVAVSHINQQMKELQAALRNLKRDLSEEKRARIKLEKNLNSDHRSPVEMRKIQTS